MDGTISTQRGAAQPAWRAFLRELPRRRFVRNVATVATGTAASQAIVMAFAPLITRLYGPEVFGLNGVFLSVVGVLSVVAALGYPTAIVLPRHDADAVGLVRLSVLIGVATTLLASSGVALFGADLLRLLNAEAIASFAYLIPAAMFSGMLADVLRQWLIRKQAYAHTAKYGVATTLLTHSTKAGLGLVHPTAFVLIATNTVGSLVATALTWAGWRRLQAAGGGGAAVAAGAAFVADRPAGEGEATAASLGTLARRHGDFALLRTPQNLINVISRSLPMLLLAAYFGAAAAGQYAIAMAVLALPTALVGTSVMAVFYPRINAAIQEGEDARSLIVKATLGMVAAGAAPFLVVIVAGPPLFELVFGAEWRTAGVYAQWLSLWLFFGFANRPSVAAIPPLRLQGVLLAHEIVSVTLRLGALYVGFRVLEDAVSAVAAFSVVGMLLNVWLIGYVVRASRHPRSAP